MARLPCQCHVKKTKKLNGLYIKQILVPEKWGLIIDCKLWSFCADSPLRLDRCQILRFPVHRGEYWKPYFYQSDRLNQLCNERLRQSSHLHQRQRNCNAMPTDVWLAYSNAMQTNYSVQTPTVDQLPTRCVKPR